MFPIANLLKSEVRQLARREGLLNVAQKRDSTEAKKGLFIDIESGSVVGEHAGLHKWTVGQREPAELKENGVLYCDFRFQHTKPLTPCRVVSNSEGLTLILGNCLRAITEGQFGVLYKDGECLGSAKINKICHNL
ncbi:putative tRNA (5-methylaminomethyl-2-thiouridylate)-methyltransferase [Operophtera brumata]|uniref:Putative tRNA (5-methylaminomethyl-2-thiouridylate)-methyltransferase n=1 Tax=Operophtera brumata TaxID=104452 RepID=A0A0L7KVW7_OPEBR|nr:putative tRNA (5-methylaminomethyl-2-thiouridylate)-methyltransferase [Operophtera brumata]